MIETAKEIEGLELSGGYSKAIADTRLEALAATAAIGSAFSGTEIEEAAQDTAKILLHK